ncbi:hypothetical protein RD110_10765 [Rhodoferax koreense]|uniref:Uncharacterized protein n=1 Tax=Rhodoferax koreensis TaxID=1842727 RepID=A0A1P8JV48_9BURK|nr:hypothetical protein [Rhodoferax koreense]APW37608.1 hypothetical protein RD110_10765 [Rhodoferax koreense]
MLTLVLVLFAPISVLVFPPPFNGIIVSLCILAIAGLEIARETGLLGRRRPGRTRGKRRFRR